MALPNSPATFCFLCEWKLNMSKEIKELCSSLMLALQYRQQNQPSQRVHIQEWLKYSLWKDWNEPPQLEPYEVAGCSPNIFFPTNELHKLPYVAVHLHQDSGHIPVSAPAMAWWTHSPAASILPQGWGQHWSSISFLPGSASASCLTP